MYIQSVIYKYTALLDSQISWEDYGFLKPENMCYNNNNRRAIPRLEPPLKNIIKRAEFNG